MPKIRAQDERIGAMLNEKQCDWDSLYTHPKLLRGYYWKDYSLNKQQRVLEIKRALHLKTNEPVRRSN
jgi:hypothetical protein